MPTSDQILGPLGALALALIVLGALVRALLLLWKEHLRADERERLQRDELHASNQLTKDLLRQALQNNADQIEAWNRRNEREAARQRRTDRS